MSIAARRSHRGDEYQLCIAVYWAIQLLVDDDIEYLQVEAVALPDEPGQVGVDDVVIVWKNGRRRFVQAKKNQPEHREWSLSDPVLRAELIKARGQLEGAETGVVELVSRTPFGALGKLVEGIRDYPHYAAFAQQAPNTLTRPLQTLAALWERQDEQAFELIRRFEIGPAFDIEGWERQNRLLVDQILANAGIAQAVPLA